MKTILRCALALALLSCAATPSQTVVGFMVHDGFDHGRSYRTWRSPGDKPRAMITSRPMQVGIWYPAGERSRVRMSLGAYTRAGATADAPGLSGQSAAAAAAIRDLEISPSFDSANLQTTLNGPSDAYRDARPSGGPFPVVLMAMGSGAPWYNNYGLAEALARRGYVVLASRSAGARHPYMSTDDAGTETGVGDLQYLAALAHTLPFADPTRLGVIGRSWGAVPAVIFAARNGTTDAIVSLDGTISYNAATLAAEHITAPYTEGAEVRTPIFVAVGANRPPGATPIDRLSYFEQVVHADAYHATYHELRHTDFASRFLDLNYSAGGEKAAAAGEHPRAGYAAVLDDVGRFLDRYVAGVGSAAVAFTDDSLRTVEFKPAGPFRPDASAFDRVAFDLGADSAIAMFRRVHAEAPEYRMFGWYSLSSLSSLLSERGSYADAIAIARFAQEQYPDRVVFLTLEGRAQFAAGDSASARAALTRALAADSAQVEARRLLARVGGDVR